MAAPLHTRIVNETNVRGRLASAAVVGVTLFLVDGSGRYAAASAAGALCIWLVADAAQVAVGDYADHVVFGLLILGGVGYAAVNAAPWWLVVPGVCLGCWFLFDGVQHLRDGTTRNDLGIEYPQDGPLLTRLPLAIVARLAAPFRR